MVVVIIALQIVVIGLVANSYFAPSNHSSTNTPTPTPTETYIPTSPTATPSPSSTNPPSTPTPKSGGDTTPTPTPTSADIKLIHYTYSIVNTYPHNENAYTQGLVYDNGSLYEGTGLYGESTLRRVKLETGEVLQLYMLADMYFGEGIAIFDGKIVQLTWLENKGFIYDKYSFELLEEFSYSTEGWGITYDGNRLIISDGTANLYFLDPETFETVGQVEVHETSPVTKINELEYIKGKVYANIYREEKIAIINPQTGQVEGWIDMSGIQDEEKQDVDDVLNGIAYDAIGDRLFVTGKRWAHLFEIKLSPVE